ncbi:hypothetical protein HCN51_56755 [Nonomuraea sp. FMUSA5-5]|uniref:Uncharacterized protein n=1 Tax=Nonomuraea composti TaxID=2720023 RepID=A0ABX1BSK8_9ACTN|nr:hypothetical protein [Nonomuraea sp. FMUSA5-5]NJP98776.1 hypothetical protein [Nonomuraea sp. FMUSA5-5]
MKENDMDAGLAVLADHRTPAEGAEFRELVSDWMETVLAHTAGDLFGPTVDPIRRASADLCSTLRIVSLRRGRRTVKEYDGVPEHYPTFWQAGLERPEEMSLVLTAKQADGSMGFPRLVTAAHRFADAPEWMTLTAEAQLAKSAVADGARLPEDFAAALRRHAERHPVQFGFVADDAEPPASALERSLGLFEEDTRPRSDHSIRGYSWVMVINPRVLEAAGGLSHLTGSGAFTAVETLSEGRVFLRATATLQEYTGAAVERVHTALEPVLPWGRPKFDPNLAYRRLIYST